jgi:hypothetical protein
MIILHGELNGMQVFSRDNYICEFIGRNVIYEHSDFTLLVCNLIEHSDVLRHYAVRSGK